MSTVIPFPARQDPKVEAWVRHFLATSAWPRDAASVARLREFLTKKIDCSGPPAKR